MCGVCGVLRLGEAPIDQELIERMTATLTHRGPDDRGTWRDDRVALGSRRLAVIDTSPAGRQPMTSEDGNVCITYNGEVYNFRELKERHRLVERGHVFRSRTDTEVLLHLYEEIGLEMLPELNGMFAIAIWDASRRQLHLCRDRYGIKPLFVQRDRQFCRFGSEIKAILADGRVGRQLSVQALHDYLSFDYIPGSQTAFDGIDEVPPSHVMTIDSSGRVSLARYWEASFQTDEELSEQAAVRRSLELMDRSVQRRLIADVPIGVLLSGGLDSSTIVALMGHHTSETIRTYSVGFHEASFNELPYARMVAERFGTAHREVIIDPARVRELLPICLRFIDEPYADGSAIPTYCVSELAKDEVVVVLSGEGGDEAFAGYETYAAYKASTWFRRVPAWVRRALIEPAIQGLPVSDKKLSLEFRLKRFLGGQDLDPTSAHFWWRIVLTEQEKRDLYQPGIDERYGLLPAVRHFQRIVQESPAPDMLAKLLHLDASLFLPDDLMIKNDRMTMAHSLEARVPMTDPELMEFMSTVPSSLKLPRLRKKHLMRGAMRNLLPRAVLNKKKVGLEMPYSQWLKSELRDQLDRYLSPDRVMQTGLFRPEAIAKLTADHLEGRRDNGRALWGLLNYMIWLELYEPTLPS